ncbi:MAG: glycerophosphodiester phosphodiesterase [Clostridiales bacterium]|nr:glycerophosphodiester phosphodiesterase [Clostridiales bacterium]
MNNKPIIYAHRGSSAYAPENTEAAFVRALEMQAGGIEIDVHLSKDGRVVICHDEKVDRVSNGTGYIKDLTLKELKTLDFGAWFSDEFIGESILTLEELLEMLSDWDGILNIELKQGPLQYEGLEAKVVNILHKLKRVDSTIISSFNHYSLRAIKELEPSLKIGLLYVGGLVEPWKYAKYVGAEAIHPVFYSLVPSVIHECRENGIIVNAWTADKPEHIQALALGGVHGIITNVPDVAIKLTSQML